MKLLKKTYTSVYEIDFGKLYHIINNSDTPIEIKIKFSRNFISTEISDLLKINEYHLDKFNVKLKLLNLSDSQKLVFENLNIDRQFNY